MLLTALRSHRQSDKILKHSSDFKGNHIVFFSWSGLQFGLAQPAYNSLHTAEFLISHVWRLGCMQQSCKTTTRFCSLYPLS